MYGSRFDTKSRRVPCRKEGIWSAMRVAVHLMRSPPLAIIALVKGCGLPAQLLRHTASHAFTALRESRRSLCLHTFISCRGGPTVSLRPMQRGVRGPRRSGNVRSFADLPRQIIIYLIVS